MQLQSTYIPGSNRVNFQLLLFLNKFLNEVKAPGHTRLEMLHCEYLDLDK